MASLLNISTKKNSKPLLFSILLLGLTTGIHAESKTIEIFKERCANAQTAKERQNYCNLVDQQRRAEEIVNKFTTKKQSL